LWELINILFPEVKNLWYNYLQGTFLLLLD
jgi:hypothetical protein